MKQPAVLLLFLILAISEAYAQPFVSISSGLPGIGRGAVAFADFDNDSDLDLILSGQDNSYSPFAAVYRNDAGQFVAVESGIAPLENCAMAVADFDLDGLQDVVITGADFDGSKTLLYRNTGNLQFVLVPAGFYNAGAGGDLAWADYNNDGYPDLVISGNWQTHLYANNGNGTFSPVEAGLMGMNTPALAWGDSDNDGDPDLLMSGDAGSVGEVYIYLNQDGGFSRLEAEIEGAVGGDARWGDADNDGNLDILITGKDATLTPVSYVYRNNGDHTFSFANAGLVGTALGPADWIDYDNDGDLDIMIAGQNAGCGNAATRLYENNGAGSFYEFPAGLAYAERAASAWGDFDNDGDYDLVLTGISTGHTTRFYRNDLIAGSFQPNTPPSVPGNLYTYVSGDYAVISWARSTDTQSPQNSITYNVMMGTSAGNIDVISPLSDPVSGHRHMTASGNAGQNDFMVFRNLLPGTYFFRVQAIDQAYEGSEFSDEGSFAVLSTHTSGQPLQAPELVLQHDKIMVNRLPESGGEAYLIGSDGRIIETRHFAGDQIEMSVNGLKPGFYVIRLITGGKHWSRKFVK
ncbi:protein containing repeat domain [Lentimicrobium saccharophilum]|uniref:Protein containing repeat domain n=1 Tax=Lentimicrobium saccharophilum TaxID=1678841 RepID=A0A0S7BYI1_9BACT|nr:FG-GAP-like repeat-containing protein [Lentimicrobium saccharophilum]GAP43575.1 protein containing repeat domain [Lentimicrobium saccharophilum]